MAIEIFKEKNNLCSEFVQSLFIQTAIKRSNTSFQIPHAKTVYKGELNLIVWDSIIPEKIKALPTFEDFKKDIDVS